MKSDKNSHDERRTTNDERRTTNDERRILLTNIILVKYFFVGFIMRIF